MERLHENGNVSVGRVIQCTPTQLRIIADRLEIAASQRAFPRDKCHYEMAPGITLEYEPALTRSSLLSRLEQDAEIEYSGQLQN